jgi:S1-C subfamily serine protease
VDYSGQIERVKLSIPLVLKYTGEKNAAGQDLFYTASGFVYLEKGLLVTCNHAVNGATKVQIKFSDSAAPIDATIVKQDIAHDFAILRFADDAREPLEGGDSSKIKEGVPVFFCGYPINLNVFTSHQGIISAITPDPLGNKWYLVDGSNNKGNSGGPLFDEDGKVIGVMQQKRLADSDSFLDSIYQLQEGTLSLNGKDMVKIYKRLIENIQLGIGQAVPIEYVTM